MSRRGAGADLSVAVRHRDEYLSEGLVLLEYHGAVHVGSFPVGREMQEGDESRNLVGPAVRGDELIERHRPSLPPVEREAGLVELPYDGRDVLPLRRTLER